MLFCRRFISPAIALALCLAYPLRSAPDSTIENRIDSLEAGLSELEQKVRSTLLFGGSSPVSFSGEARLKAQYHSFIDYPEYMRKDRAYVQSGWDGNEGLVRLGMVARPGRNTVLWARLGFQHTLPGNRVKGTKRDGGFIEVPTRHDKTNTPIYIHEDMCAGLAVRTVPASFWVKMGNVLWTEASPLTIWKAQPRLFAWEYLPFEVEQPIGRYYEYNIAKGEKAGRAAWHKKAFNGLNLESISLPWDLYVNLLYGSFEAYDKGERENVDFSNDLAYADFNNAVKGHGVGDSYRHLFHGRLAAGGLIGDLTPGINVNVFTTRDDIVRAAPFNKVFGIDSVLQDLYRVWLDAADDTIDIDTTQVEGTAFRGYTGSGFFKEPTIASLDLRGAIGEKLSLHTDIAVSLVETTWVEFDTSVDFSTRTSRGDPGAAFYGRVELDGRLPVSTDLAVIGRKFYSPFSFASPADAFYAFGSNLLGPGKFLSGEASPYVPNMAGVNLRVEPRISGYGHLRFVYGQHFQLEPARDLLFFPYRLNGQDMFTFFHSSYNRWGNGLVDHSIANTTALWYQTDAAYQKRLGDESFRTSANLSPMGPDAGGLRSNYLSMMEGFVAYQNAAQADSNLADSTGILNRSPFVPEHRKYTVNLEVDAAYDIGPIVHFPRDLFMGGYASLSGVSTTFSPLAVNYRADDVLLWSTYLRFEPAMELVDDFYLIGLAGFENWRSQKAYMADSTGSALHAPIDFRDVAVGLGFDWGMLDRVGLHMRAKWMKHEDVNYPDNNWETPVVSGEIKMWF